MTKEKEEEKKKNNATESEGMSNLIEAASPGFAYTLHKESTNVRFKKCLSKPINEKKRVK